MTSGGVDGTQALALVMCLVIVLGAYGAERRWAKASKVLSGPTFHEIVARIQAGQVDAAGFGVLRRAHHQNQPTLPAHLRALQDKIALGQTVSLYDPGQKRQIEAPSLAQFDAWAAEHFPGVLG